jgi:hypothetical protein
VSSPPRTLHVANGTATTTLIGEAGIPGVSSIWADPLHEGPVPGDVSDERLIEIRAAYLAGHESSPQAAAEIAEELRRWRAAIDDDSAFDELVLWFEHDLFDQLNLIQVLSRIARKRPRPTAVSLICIGSFPGRQSFKGLGELTPGELTSLLETRLPVTEPQYALAERTWDAYRAPDPRPLQDLVRGDTSALPFLALALRRHFEEFPWTSDGLSRTERRVLELASPGPIDVRSAFDRMHDDETAFYIADGSFWTVVTELAAGIEPLVVLDVESTGSLPRHGTITLTDTSRSILTGQADRVTRCGIDRWLGGVHLTGHGPTWRWDSARSHIVRIPGEPR